MDLLQEFGDPERVAERLEFHRRVIAEEESARDVCERALTGPSSWWGNAIRQLETSRTAGMVAVLIERSEAVFPRSPLDALALSDVAAEIATSIPLEAYPYDHVAKVRGQALRRQAFVLSYLGRLPEAANVAERSAFYLRQLPVPMPDMARLDLARSNIARNMEKYGQAIEHARRAQETFLAFGDRQAWLKAVDYEAAALFSSLDYRAALAVWQSMEEYAAQMTLEHRAMWLLNTGLCASRAGDFDEAVRRYAKAADVFERVGSVINRVKCKHGVAEALLALGKPEEAIEVADAARAEFETLGMQTEATLTALLLAECLLAADRPDEVPAVCRHLIDRSVRAGIQGPAMTALAYLRESVARGHASTVIVRHVHEFISDLDRGFEKPFAPFHEPRLDA